MFQALFCLSRYKNEQNVKKIPTFSLWRLDSSEERKTIINQESIHVLDSYKQNEENKQS